MTAQKETAPAVQAEAVNEKDSAHVSANDDRQPAQSSQAAMSVDLAAAALRLAANDRPVFPVNPSTRTPLVKWGPIASSKPNPAQIAAWWDQWPDACIALVTGYGLAVIDLDCKDGRDGFASLRALEEKHGTLPPTMTIETPSGGRHLYFRTPKGRSIRCGTNLPLGLSGEPKKSGIDVRANGGYVLAPPSIINGRSYSVAANDGEVADAPEWLLQFMESAPAQVDAPLSGGSTRITRQQIADLAGALHFHDPDDYSAWINAGMALHELGQDGFGLWVEFSSRSPKFDEAALREKWATFHPSGTGFQSIFKTAQSNGWRNPAGRGAAFAPPIEDEGADGGFIWGDVLTSPEHLKAADWLVRSIIPAECTGLLVGKWGTCKTFVALDFAGCIASGKDWHGHATRQGTVFYLCGEGESGIARRLRAWEIGNGGSVAGIAVRQMPDIRDAETLARMMGTIERLTITRGQPRLILIDTLFTALNGGNENSGQDMGEVFRAMRALRQRFRCAVIAVHHTGHDEERARGHSSMEAGVDVQLFLSSDQRAGATILTLSNRKQKDGAPFEPITLTTEDVKLVGLTDDLGQVESSLVIRRAGDAQMAEHEAMLADMRLEGSKLPGDRKRREEMIQFAVDMWPEIQNLQAICDLIYEKYGHKKHPPRVKDWLNKRGIDTSRRT